eukprot:CAMPEP_0118687096 /NCGR_PEP_ID=MMETSP0800-20121206/8189_1 /TAXON_ID=210618 ORGANISM="Striatella unipunctata, Strain CCMP2910" /NCGR_SAMPLE_ID=MMETSP0800 /ASSEMBLY_ACC=CAM_ASM_000638 /LENGTH=238 /DNA_ID=CAMNT_0006584235 /DNA_START=166 /DNA_END=882 /DNA_ORIENTATION=-
MSCSGRATRLELVQNWPVAPRDEAIQTFVRQVNQRYSHNSTNRDGKSSEGMEGAPIVIMSQDDAKEEFHPAQSISCKGSTEVQMLVLRQGNKEEIVGVSPHCGLGITHRQDKNMIGKETTTVGLGALEIKLTKVPDEISDLDTTDGTDSKSKTPIETTRTSGTSILTNPAFPKKFLEHLKANSIFLKDQLQDHFPERMFEASKRIVKEIPKNVERSKKGMEDLYKLFSTDDDDDDEDL